MPVLGFDETPKRFILPSTEKDADQAWVEMKTYPLCTDDYGVYNEASYLYGRIRKEDPTTNIRTPVLNMFILERRITSWNMTDKDKKPLPVVVDNIKHLQNRDVSFLIEQIEQEPKEELDPLKKNSSLAPSLPPPADPAS